VIGIIVGDVFDFQQDASAHRHRDTVELLCHKTRRSSSQWCSAAWWMIRLISGEKDCKGVLTQKMATFNHFCDVVACNARCYL